MSAFQRYFHTLLMAALTSWLIVTTIGIAIFGNDSVLTGRLIGITLLCVGATCLFFVMEMLTPWSSDRKPNP